MPKGKLSTLCYMSVRVYDGDKLDFTTSTHEVSDLACLVAVLEWLEAVGRCIYVDSSFLSVTTK